MWEADDWDPLLCKDRHTRAEADGGGKEGSLTGQQLSEREERDAGVSIVETLTALSVRS